MAHSYTVRMPDGKEYGPADLEALESWQREGRINATTLVWKQGDHDWRPLSQVLDTGEVAVGGAAKAAPVAAATEVTVVTSTPQPTAAAGPPLDESGGPTVKLQAPGRTRPTPAVPRTARRKRPSPLRILVPLAVVAALVTAGALWWMRGQPERDRRRSVATIRSFGTPERSFSDEGLGLRLDLPDGWIVLRPDNPLFHAPDARLRLAHPGQGSFGRLFAEPNPRGSSSLDEMLDRAVGNWQLLASGLREDGRKDVAVSGSPGRRATTAWSADGQPMRGSVTVWKDGWNEFALAVWGPGDAAPAEAEHLVARVKMSGTAMARVRAAADTVAPEMPELGRESVEALVLQRLARNEPTADLPQTSLRAVSRGLPALTSDESHEMGRIYLQVYKPLKDKERAQLASWMNKVRTGVRADGEEDLAMRVVLRDGILALPEDVRARLQALNEKAVLASLAR